MVSLFLLIGLVIACFILRGLFLIFVEKKPDLKFFLFWICVCIALYYILSVAATIYAVLAYCFVFGADAEDSPKRSSDTNTNSRVRSSEDKIYKNGVRRIGNISETGYYYSDGTQSWKGMLGEEHRSNGETVYDNAYVAGKRDIYDKNGNYIGYEYEDSVGITHRVNKK